jgi:hypothetical protein
VVSGIGRSTSGFRAVRRYPKRSTYSTARRCSSGVWCGTALTACWECYGVARNPKVPTLFQVADVDTGVINWINADLVTHICPRV